MDAAGLAAFLYLYGPQEHPWNGNTHSWRGVPRQLVQSRYPSLPTTDQVFQMFLISVHGDCHRWSIIYSCQNKDIQFSKSHVRSLTMFT